MSETDLELFLLRIALPPARLGMYVKRLNARRADSSAAPVVKTELRRAARIRARSRDTDGGIDGRPAPVIRRREREQSRNHAAVPTSLNTHSPRQRPALTASRPAVNFRLYPKPHAGGDVVPRSVRQTLFPPHSCQVVYVEGGCFSSTTTGSSR
jgi:hypothetical protein